MSKLAGKRILVIGGSAGIGRAVAEGARAEGARVVAAARRREGPVTLVCDVRHPVSCEAAVAAAVAELGGLDALVYAAGVAPLATLDVADPAAWSAAFETNVAGAAYAARLTRRHLAASDGRGVFFSSDSVGDPREGLVTYVASKAALEQLVLGLRREHPEVHWTTVVVGPTATSIAADWDRKLASRLWRRWQSQGYDRNPPASPAGVARIVLEVLGSAEDIPRVSTHDPV